MSKTIKQLTSPTKDYTVDQFNGKITNELLQLSAQLRIADALELFTADHRNLLKEYEYWKQCAADRYEQVEQLKRSNAALKGQITKLKNQRHETV